MAFTKVVGAGIHTLSNITSHNIHSSGIVTATALDISGNATIGGVLTYEDVTSIDSVGLITARDGVFIPDNQRIRFGNTNTSPNFSIYSTPTYKQGVIDYTHSGTGRALRIRATNLQIENWNGLTPTAKFVGGVGVGHVELNYAGDKKFETITKGIQVGTGVTIETNGQATFTGIVTATSFKLANGSDVGTGAGGTWSTYTAGIATSKSVGVNTTNLDDNDLVGVGNSFQGLYISNGMIVHDNTLNGNHYIGTTMNGLMAGPVTIEGTLTVDGNYVVV